MRIGRAAINHVRTKGPAILQVHTFRFNGHSPADPEHERNRKDEKRWARAACDPIKIFEESADVTRVDVEGCTSRAKEEVRKALEFANASPPPSPHARRGAGVPRLVRRSGLQSKRTSDGPGEGARSHRDDRTG